VLRSWPWTIALAAVVGVVLLAGMFAFSVRSSLLGMLLSLITIGVALLALFRVLTSGVYLLPSGIIIRELTSSTPVPWPRVRSITNETTGRRGVHVPVLVVTPAPGESKEAAKTRIEVTILGSYSEVVARRRTDELVAAKKAAGTAGKRAGSS
jgi:hypothetical protein